MPHKNDCNCYNNDETIKFNGCCRRCNKSSHRINDCWCQEVKEDKRIRKINIINNEKNNNSEKTDNDY